MKGKYARAVRVRFHQRITTVIPDAREITKSIVLPPGERVYEWKIRDDFVVYIELFFAKRFDQFYVRIIITAQQEFPSTVIPMGAHEYRNGVICFHVEELWRGRHNCREWNVPTFFGEVPPEDQKQYAGESIESRAMLTVIPAVDNAISMIREYLLPHVDRVMNQRTMRS